MMRALFVYKYQTTGGVEAVLRARLDGLGDLGVEAQAWFLRDGGGRSIFRGLEDRVHIGGVYDLQRFVEAWGPDAVTLIDTEEAFPVLGDGREATKLLIEVHTPYRENRVYLRWIGRLPVSGFIVPTAYQASIVESRTRGIAPVHVVPNPLRTIFTSRPTGFVPVPRRPIVGWVGRLDALKNWKDFLDITAELSRIKPEAEFWLVGEWPGRSADQRLLRHARRRGLLRRLRWFSSLPHEHMPRFFDAVRDSGGALVSTSLEESFGMVVAEAMSRGCAVAVPRRSAFLDFVRHGEHGIVFRPGSAPDAAKGIARLIADDSLRRACGERGRVDILKDHDPAVALPILSHLLLGLTKGQLQPADAP
ncbi:MAG: glycosyltransferase family 4 protein [Actinobacteria bacterium]|nr:glycosyltransferase family 4 protein [Actinomycetota bacterium]